MSPRLEGKVAIHLEGTFDDLCTARAAHPALAGIRHANARRECGIDDVHTAFNADRVTCAVDDQYRFRTGGGRICGRGFSCDPPLCHFWARTKVLEMDSFSRQSHFQQRFARILDQTARAAQEHMIDIGQWHECHHQLLDLVAVDTA